MKKIMMMVMGVLVMGSGYAFAAQADSFASADLGKGGQLVSIDSPSNRINQMERRMASLERDMRAQSDYIRSLERDLNDLRRRR